MFAILAKQLSKRSNRSLTLLILLAGMVALTGCRQQAEAVDESGGFAFSDSSDVLQNLTLVRSTRPESRSRFTQR